jgi:anaerobic ribonucleoside-triphosphate reductase activating protein
MKISQIKIAGIVRNSIVDGPGIRYTIFAQGCSLNCPDCHNPHTHDFNGGELREIREIADEIKKDPLLLDGVTFSGGEPFEQAEAFAELADLIPERHIICYTGYNFDELYREPKNYELLSKIDVLVDGRFESAQKSVKAKFKGSVNQRVIDCKESVRVGKAIEFDF